MFHIVCGVMTVIGFAFCCAGGTDRSSTAGAPKQVCVHLFHLQQEVCGQAHSRKALCLAQRGSTLPV
jgi:hypothetical protein